jgi:peptidoglycan/LPS O-acetylase OafA/YrhL
VDVINRLSQGQETAGSLAVNLFFLISGFLITASWLHSSSMQNFLQRRVLRIYPAYVVALTFCALLIWGVCPAFRVMPEHQGMPYFLTLISWGIDFMKDCVMLTFNSISWKGVFTDNPYPGCANASLWTIQKEFFCYLLVAGIGQFALFKRRWLTLLAALVIYAAYAKALLTGVDVEQMDRRYLCYFFVGMNFWLWRDKIPYSPLFAAGCLLPLVLGAQFKPFFSILMPVAGGYLVLWLGYGPKVSLFDWTHRMDLSYGTYLYAYPVQQHFAMSPSLREPLANFALTVPCVLALAFLSWNLIEKPFLALKNYLPLDRDPGEGKPKALGA